MGVPVADHQFKVPVVRRPDFTLFLEQATRHHTFIHCSVYRWSPAVKKQLLADWQVLKGLVGAPIYALHTPGDIKHHKFLRLFGFHLVTSYPDDAAGAVREIFST